MNALLPAAPARRWRTAIEGHWSALAAGLLATSLLQGLRPSNWRRPVSDAFWRHLEFATLGSLAAVLVAALVVGLGIVAQALYWLDELGEPDAVRSTLMRVLLREVAPVTVGLVMLGRSGLMHLTELATLRDDGTVRVLRAEGLDPALFLVMPRILSLGIATFCHAILFTLVAIGVGYLSAALLGLTVLPAMDFGFEVVRQLGAAGVVVVPIKTFVIGLVIGAVTSATALDPKPDGRRLALPLGYFRSLIALFVVSGTLSLML